MSPDSKAKIKAKALALLEDPDFFGQVRKAVSRGGLVGERQNAVAIFIIAISALLDRPLNGIVKGRSSAGKNFLVSRVLNLLPRSATVLMTSSSKGAWDYAEDAFRHKVIYIHERNDAAGAIHPARTLISENELRHSISVWEQGERKRKELVVEGPISAISTTTEDRLEVDDETRSVSLWVDESAEQTQRIVKRLLSPLPPLTPEEIEVWHRAYELLAQRASVKIEFPEWFGNIGNSIFYKDVRVRRYLPAFLEAVRTIALIRSFQTRSNEFGPDDSIPVTFTDYAIATYIFDIVFAESLFLVDDDSVETRNVIEAIASTQGGKAVDQEQVAQYLKISADKAYSKIRSAREAGMIVQVNQPEKNNIKRYLPAPRPRFVPDPKEVFAKISGLKKPLVIIHPVAGKEVRFTK
jgi:hypothetical protein